MNSVLDILGSVVIGGLVLLLLAQVNSSMRSSNYEQEFDMLNQQRIIGTNEVIRDDFYKIGYRISGNKILVADSTTIKYCSDYDNNGVSDTIRYYLGNKSELLNTTNPNDMPLHKILNSGKTLSLESVTNFKLIYFDSSGTKITYASLVNQSNRKLIRGIQLNIDCQSPEPVNNAYESISWQQVIKPKNLK